MASATAVRRQNTPVPARVLYGWRARAILVVLLAGLVFALVSAGLRPRLPPLADPPLRTLVVRGALHHISPAIVREVVRTHLHGGFFSVDIGAICHAIEALPWVRRAHVRRAWPGTVHVKIIEQVPVARWGANGLLNTHGRVFMHTAQAPSALPRFNAPAGSGRVLLHEYTIMRQLLATTNMRIHTLSMDARGAWDLVFDSGLQLHLGRSDENQRLRRFARIVLPALAQQLSAVNSIDMRYTNGFAVGWKDSAAGVIAKDKGIHPHG